MNDKTWQKNAPSQITLNSIFAAMVGVLIVIAIQDSTISDHYKFVVLALLIFAFLFFAISAEQTTNALDERDAKKYVYYMIWYNAGVILTGVSISLIIYTHFSCKLSIYLWQHLPLIGYLFAKSELPIIVSFIVSTSILLIHWIDDLRWLLFVKNSSMIQYLNELEDKSEPVSDPSMLMKIYYKWKKIT
jgi:hypothetical protein